MKKLIFSSLIGLALVAFTGCYGPTADTTAETQKCQAGKCGEGKCGTDTKKVETPAKKCQAGKCGEGKCGSK